MFGSQVKIKMKAPEKKNSNLKKSQKELPLQNFII